MLLKLSLALKNIQCSPAYRGFVRRIRPKIQIYECNDQSLLEKKYFAIIPSANTTNYIARTSHIIAGIVQLVRHPPEDFPQVGYWLENLRVLPLFRRMGIGEELSKRVIDQAYREGSKELFLSVVEENFGAYNLYKKLGFHNTTIPGYGKAIENINLPLRRRPIIMRKDLTVVCDKVYDKPY